jgi:hypothetical protein
MPAWISGGTRYRRRRFCASGWEETKEGAAVWWLSPDDRNWLRFPDRYQRVGGRTSRAKDIVSRRGKDGRRSNDENEANESLDRMGNINRVKRDGVACRARGWPAKHSKNDRTKPMIGNLGKIGGSKAISHERPHWGGWIRRGNLQFLMWARPTRSESAWWMSWDAPPISTRRNGFKRLLLPRWADFFSDHRHNLSSAYGQVDLNDRAAIGEAAAGTRIVARKPALGCQDCSCDFPGPL